MFYWNCRSLLNVYKRHKLCHFILTNCYDIVCLTETWFSYHINDNEIYLDSYKIYRNDRGTKEHGGVCIAIRKDIKSKQIDLITHSSDVICVSIDTTPKTYIIVVYNSPINSQYRIPICNLDFLFSEVLNEVNMERGKVFIVGDFNFPNINWCLDDFSQLTDEDFEFIYLLDRLKLTQIIDYPTHNCGNTIDLVITNDLHCSTDRATNLDIESDHYAINANFTVGSSNGLQNKSNPESKNYWTLNNINLEVKDKITNDLINLQHFLEHTPNNGTKFDIFQDFFTKSLITHCPRKNFCTKKRSSLPPWVSSTTSHLLNKLTTETRKRNCKTGRTTNTNINNIKPTNSYNKLDILKKQIDLSLAADYNNYSSVLATNIIVNKHHYNYIKNLTKNRVNIDNTYDENGNLLTTNTQIAEGFNIYYNSVYTRVPVDINSSCSIDMIITDKLTDFKISRDDVTQAIKTSKLKGKKPGQVVTPEIIELFYNLIVDILTTCFNDICTSCIFPDSWKETIITPIPKTKKPKSFSDYRPVAAINSAAKIFEKIINNKLYNHLEPYLINEQHGFRKRRSVITQMCSFMDDVHSNLDTYSAAKIFYADVSKAFDSVNHKFLCEKLQIYGVNENALKLLTNYLANRRHKVFVNGISSKALPMTAGVPQGSVLGPLLFILFINDIVQAHSLGKTYIFADDIKVIVNNNLDAQSTMNEFAKLTNWYDNNGLNLNIKKCEILNINNKCNSAENLKFSTRNEDLKQTTTIKDLGIIVTHKLKWTAHVTQRLANSNKIFQLIQRNTGNYFVKEVKRTIFIAYVMPVLNYGNPIYHPNKADLRRIDHFIFRGLKWVTNDYKKDFKQLCIDCSFLPFGYSIAMNSVLFLFKIWNNMVDVKKPNYVTQHSKLDTRNKKFFSLPRVHNERTRNNFWYRTCSLINLFSNLDLNCNWYSFKRATLITITDHFILHYDKSNKCTWTVICDCSNCRLQKYHVTR